MQDRKNTVTSSYGGCIERAGRGRRKLRHDERLRHEGATEGYRRIGKLPVSTRVNTSGCQSYTEAQCQYEPDLGGWFFHKPPLDLTLAHALGQEIF